MAAIVIIKPVIVLQIRLDSSHMVMTFRGLMMSWQGLSCFIIIIVTMVCSLPEYVLDMAVSQSDHHGWLHCSLLFICISNNNN